MADGLRDGGYLQDVGTIPDDRAEAADQLLLEAERHVALRQALADLPPCCQQLIALLTSDPPLTYAEISVRLGIAVGSIGPSRGRCLDKLRRHPSITALINAEAQERRSRHRCPAHGAELTGRSSLRVPRRMRGARGLRRRWKAGPELQPFSAGRGSSPR